MQSVRPEPTDRHTDRRQRQFQGLHDVVMVRYRRSQFLKHRIVERGSVGETAVRVLPGNTFSPRRRHAEDLHFPPAKLPRDNPRTSSATWERRAPGGPSSSAAGRERLRTNYYCQDINRRG
jgi:hypothetical protein